MHLGFAEDVGVDADGDLIDDVGQDPSNIPHKIGGRPLWLDPTQPLPATALRCGVCESETPMALLTQVFTPDDVEPQAYLRTVHVFSCRDGRCHKDATRTGAVKCLRSQLPRGNAFWLDDVDDDDAMEETTTNGANGNLCVVCNLGTSKRCGRCGVVGYCCRAHQELDWRVGGHSLECCGKGGERPRGARRRVAMTALFPESEIVTELEPKEDKTKKDATTLDDVTRMTEALSFGGGKEDPNAKDEDAEFEETKVGVDDCFLAFQRRVEREPEQVMRLARLTPSNDQGPEDDDDDDEGMQIAEIDDDKDEMYDEYDASKDRQPLWVSSTGIPTDADIPACPHCGSARTFELQIMPQLLTRLRLNHADPDALDFGTLVVYSCPRLCLPVDASTGRAVAHLEEFVVRQDFSEAGMGDAMRAIAARRHEEQKAAK